jgi:hypothetical protein
MTTAGLTRLNFDILSKPPKLDLNILCGGVEMMGIGTLEQGNSEQTFASYYDACYNEIASNTHMQ